MAVRIETNTEPIPGYRLIERLGGGGFGEVWKAEAPGGLMKAIKFVYGDLHTLDEEEGVRAEQELKAMRRVQAVRHPYILSLERYDIIEGQLIIVMELADRNLWDRFKECRGQGLPGIPRIELLAYMAEIAEALDLMNKEYQLQHLDIKPQNLFLVHNHIKVADFGLVKDLEGMVASVTGGVTPVYAAPETFDGWVSRYCDQYSLAIVYQELLSGHRPFTSTNVRQLVLAHLQAVPDLSSLPACDRDVIARALAKNPENRHPSCQTLVRGLQEAPGRAKKDSAGGDSALVETPSVPLTELPEGSAAGGDSVGPSTKWIRTHEVAPKQTPVQRVAIPEVQSDEPAPRRETVGDGQLFPALVIGLGGIGLGVLKGLSATLNERFGRQEALPNLRLLYIDTDPDSQRLAAEEPDGGELTRNEVLLAPLHRPSYYLKPRDGRVRIDTWLNPKMLYRIPRHAFSGGMRALGRLAFVDNYRSIASRLRSELEACADPTALTEAAKRTGLGIRTNKPRVYVITSLAGGTGSGMFLDLAYVVRTLLRQQGYDQAEVVGLFFLPVAQRGAAQATELGNAYAALTELNHFSTAGTTFSASYDTQDARVTGPIVDASAPFNWCFLLPTIRPGWRAGSHEHPERESQNGENRTGRGGTVESLALGSHFLVCDLTTPLGRSADISRRDRLMEATQTAANAESTPQLYCQTFGMHRLVWPRRLLLRQAARRLCQRLVERWMSKDGKPIREQVKDWVEEQWMKQDLGAEALITQLQQACTKALKTAPEQLFTQILSGITRLAAPDAKEELTEEQVGDVLGQLEQVLGRAQESATVMRQDKSGPPGQVEAILRESGESLLAQLTQKMAELAVCLIEQPAFRLAGAEEAIRQITTTIEQTLHAQEQIAKELAERAHGTFGNILVIYKNIKLGKAGKPAAKRAGKGGWWGGNGAAEETPNSGAALLNDLLKAYCKSRYQCLILQRAVAIFLSLRGQLSDQMREVGFCRNRLLELSKSFGQAPGRSTGHTSWKGKDAGHPGLARYLFPAGCSSLEDSIASLLETVTEEQLQDLDQRMETLIRRDFTALVHVCLAAANMLRNLEQAMQKEAETVLEGRVVGVNVTEMYLAQRNVEEDAQVTLETTIAEGFDDAAPDLGDLIAGSRPARSSEICILAAPIDAPASAGQPNLKEAAPGALPGQQVLVVDAGPGTAGTEILYYREEACLALSDLKLLGPAGRDAYRQMSAVDHFTPHARIDITEWQPGTAVSGQQSVAQK
jgi:serine/threonine protein kinase